jgi:hypothetical protein
MRSLETDGKDPPHVEQGSRLDKGYRVGPTGMVEPHWATKKAGR